MRSATKTEATKTVFNFFSTLFSLKVSALSAVTVLFVGFSANGLALPNGVGFIPQQCGPQTNDVGRTDHYLMESACIGTIAGETVRAVRFTLTNDQEYVFRIKSQINLMMALASGATMSVFQLIGENGEQITMKAIVNHDGSIKSISGNFQTNSYVVPTFQPMLTIQ